ncbi:hypothetical protein KTC96_22585 (plasmid) [Clostridium estertheticum]|uniref:hypothetical protein n=1 Tax=Clostridium estertheticum TaxID=238834 RepID=UPI001C7E0DD9|nr:hypothetical protein [Clostridium estertheticum]MBX4260415.1 hypothetical protein [Clostridium estertheticum]WLC73003.1 hypothetical protein KTC96_22585 [Clostridium estertheticum]
MDKKIKLVGYIIMQTLVVLAAFLFITLALKYDFLIVPPMIILGCTQLVLLVFVVNNILGNRKK